MSVAQESFQASIDPAAAGRWARLAQRGAGPNWLHEEVGARLLDRIDLVQLPAVRTWVNGHCLPGAEALQQALAARWPDARCYAPSLTPSQNDSKIIAAQAVFSPEKAEITEKNAPALPQRLRQWWQQARGSGRGAAALPAVSRPVLCAPPPQSAQVLVANLLLHSSANPEQLLKNWHDSLATGGVLFFSALGPDTLKPLQQLHARMGWPAPMQRLVDMHDWGDALVNTGFATPVMEMERITATYSSAKALRTELRALGRNLHPQRFRGLRGRSWGVQWLAAVEALKGSDGRIHIPIEIIYGHAFKPAPREAVGAGGEQLYSLEKLRGSLPSRRA